MTFCQRRALSLSVKYLEQESTDNDQTHTSIRAATFSFRIFIHTIIQSIFQQIFCIFQNLTTFPSDLSSYLRQIFVLNIEITCMKKKLYSTAA